MDSTWWIIGILLVGVAIVVGGVLVLRLHAFLALTLAALVVAALTPRAALERSVLDRARLDVLEVDADARRVVLRAPDRAVEPGTVCLVLEPSPERNGFETAARLVVDAIDEAAAPSGKAIRRATAVVPADAALPQPGAFIVPAAARRAAAGLAGESIGERVAAGFGRTAAQIGILIAMASIIGKCLLDSGAADRIVRSALRLLGEGGAPLAFLLSGFLLGIPVFFDTVFYLMIPLGKAMRLRTGRNYLLYVLTIVAGATMAHSLVPPTPGPLLVADQLGVDLGTMILGGCVVGLFTSAVGYVFAVVVNRFYPELPLRELPDFSLAELEAVAGRSDRELPPLWLSLVPILLPVVLIGGSTIVESDQIAARLSPVWRRAAEELGNKDIALTLSAAIALAMLGVQKRASLAELAKAVQAALASGGIIILITAAGGAFGGVLQQTGVATLIDDLPRTSPAMIVTLAFLITTAIRTAQGSATVAMITAVGVLSGLASSGALGFHPVYLALAIGCGSKPIAWMNDSGFWVICKMSGMTEAEMLKSVTPMTALMGVSGLGAVIVGVTLWPMA